METEQFDFYKKIKFIITNVKNELEKDPSNIIFAKFSSELKGIRREDALHIDVYYNFLQVCDGCYCGDIVLWSYDELIKHQYSITKELNESGSWIAIGQIQYYSLILNINNNKVYKLSYEYGEDENFHYINDFYVFILEYLFGYNYIEISSDPENDEWILFLNRIRNLM